MRIYFPKLVPPCPLTRSHALSPSHSQNPLFSVPRLETSHFPLLFKSPKSLRRNCSFLALFAVSFPVFTALATVFFYLLILTGSVGRRILFVVPVDTYRTSIISTVLPLNLRKSIFGSSLFILDLWSRPWGVARLLGFRGVPPRPHPSEGVGLYHHHVEASNQSNVIILTGNPNVDNSS